jgi:hypothetical protein
VDPGETFDLDILPYDVAASMAVQGMFRREKITIT